jgi:hypothetical protein
VETGDHAHGPGDEREEQRVRKTAATSPANILVDDGKLLWLSADPLDNDFDAAIRRSSSSASRAAYQSRLQAVQRRLPGWRRPTARSAPLSELGPKLIPRSAFLPILIETHDPSVEFSPLGIGQRHILLVATVPEWLDQIEPLARRKPGELGC